MNTFEISATGLVQRLGQIAAEEACAVSAGYVVALEILLQKYAPSGADDQDGNSSFRDWLGRSRLTELSGTVQCGSIRAAFDFSAGASFIRQDACAPKPFERFCRHFETLLAWLAANPGEPVRNAEYLTAPERIQILTDWSRAVTYFPRSSTVQALFAVQVMGNPDAPAVSASGEGLTYRELDTASSRLANFLIRHGVGEGKVVGLSLDRSPELVIAMLATLKCGACYLPIDASYPVRRQRLMIEDASACVILTDSTEAEGLLGTGASVIDLRRAQSEIARESDQLTLVAVKADAPAYIIYTSGSTGNPKGVIVNHRAIVRLVRNTNYIEIESSDCIAQMANASFDAITFEVWGALLNGARVEMLPASILLSPALLASAIRDRKISVVFLTTALFNLVARCEPAAFSPLRYLLMGGEAASPEYQRKVLSTAPPEKMLHVYGPTENATFSLWHPIEHVAEGAATIPIGRPVSNTEAYILDRRMQLVPPGVEGELFLGGDGLALGYLNRPDLTEERFVPHPYSKIEGAKLYRTGDRVRYLDDGAIDFIGRTDHQVKVRGHRIELGEIEAALREHSGIADCVVVVRTAALDGKQLAAYLVNAGAFPAAATALREHLRSRLPEYMIPASFTFLDALPLTPSGKIDRNATFPAPVESEPGGVQPVNRIQKEIADIWSRQLGRANIGIDENFFDAGGDSLTLAAIELEIRNRLRSTIQITDLFRYTTIRSLAEHIAAETNNLNLPSRSIAARERAAQAKAALASLIPRVNR